MQYNYHTHTPRYNHAVGDEREYIENAIRAGIKVLGFSDHAPVIFGTGHYSHFRMKPEETEGYIRTVLDLKREYENDIKLRVGFELEYYPAHFEDTLNFLSQYPYEYLLLGQHALGNEEGEPYSSRYTEDESIFIRYVEQTIEGMRTGKFLYLAHPDLINYSADGELYREWMSKLCVSANELDVPIEINLLGIQRARNYPNLEFWKLAAEHGCKTVLGIDAHAPEDILDASNEERAREIARMCGLDIIESLEDRFV